MFKYWYECDACAFRGVACCARIAYYVFPDGERMPAALSPAWCGRCKNFVSAETLPTAESVITEIARLEEQQAGDSDDRLAESLKRSVEGDVSLRLAALRELNHRFRNRRSTNRCIECGGTDFDYLRDDDGPMPKAMPHPNCHGTLRLVEAAHASTTQYETLDQEGNRVSDESATRTSWLARFARLRERPPAASERVASPVALLTRKEIAQFPIDARAIELVPEAVAREWLALPVRYSDAMLHLVLPAEAGLATDDTLEALRFILNRPFTHQFAATDDLWPFVDFYYTAFHSEVTNCEATFRIKCPKRWAELDATDDVRVRYCNVCQRAVTFCREPEELAQLAARQECVAFFDRTGGQEFLGLPE